VRRTFSSAWLVARRLTVPTIATERKPPTPQRNGEHHQIQSGARRISGSGLRSLWNALDCALHYIAPQAVPTDAAQTYPQIFTADGKYRVLSGAEKQANERVAATRDYEAKIARENTPIGPDNSLYKLGVRWVPKVVTYGEMLELQEKVKQASKPVGKALTNDDVLSLRRAGFTDQLIVAKVKSVPGDYKLDVDDLLAPATFSRRGFYRLSAGSRLILSFSGTSGNQYRRFQSGTRRAPAGSSDVGSLAENCPNSPNPPIPFTDRENKSNIPATPNSCNTQRRSPARSHPTNTHDFPARRGTSESGQL
jgi:hypothetical protein